MNLGFDSRQVFCFERLLLVVNRGLLLRKRVAANSFLPFIFSSSVLHHRRFPFFVLGFTNTIPLSPFYGSVFHRLADCRREAATSFWPTVQDNQESGAKFRCGT